MARLFQVWGAATAALTAPPVLIASSASTSTPKTAMQLKPNTREICVIEWGYTIDVLPTAGLRVELIDTGTVPATGLTNFAAGDIIKYGSPNDAASTLSTGGGNTSGFGATGEGTITATRLADFHYENGLYLNKQYPLAREFYVPITNYLRVRITPSSAAIVNILPYILFEE